MDSKLFRAVDRMTNSENVNDVNYCLQSLQLMLTMFAYVKIQTTRISELRALPF